MRIGHWTIVLALVVLSVTGYYIYHPFFSGSGGPAHPGFTMGTVRFVHEVTGFVFIAAVLFRVYRAFAGNRYAHWRGLLPVTAAQRRGMLEMLRYYFYRRRHPLPMNGHNPLAGMAYVLLYALLRCRSCRGLVYSRGSAGSPPGGRCSAGRGACCRSSSYGCCTFC